MRAILNYDHQYKVREFLEDRNFKSNVRETAKEIYEDISASRVDESQRKLGGEIEYWLEVVLDIVFDVDVEYDHEDGVVYMVILERINPEDDEYREDTRVEKIDVEDIIGELQTYRRGGEVHRARKVTRNYLEEDRNKRNFKNLTRNIVTDEIRSFMDTVIYDVSEANDYVH